VALTDALNEATAGLQRFAAHLEALASRQVQVRVAAELDTQALVDVIRRKQAPELIEALRRELDLR